MLGDGSGRESSVPAAADGLAVFQKDSQTAESLIAFFQEFVNGLGHQLTQRTTKIKLQPAGHKLVVTMGAAGRFAKHGVDDSQSAQVLRSHLQGFGRPFLEGVALPQDAGATFGANHRIIRMFEHCNSVADANAQAPPDPPSPITAQTIGVARRDISNIELAITWAWPRSSAPIPG